MLRGRNKGGRRLLAPVALRFGFWHFRAACRDLSEKVEPGRSAETVTWWGQRNKRG